MRKEQPLRIREILKLSWEEIRDMQLNMKDKLKTLQKYWAMTVLRLTRIKMTLFMRKLRIPLMN